MVDTPIDTDVAQRDRRARQQRAERPPRPPRLASIVVEELSHEIIGGQLPEGSALPTEDALCGRFGYHKAVMREALKLLEAHGLIRVEQGRGSTVQPRESWNLLDADVLRIALEYDHDIRLFDNIVKVRLLLEMAMTREATLLLTDDDIADLRANLDAMAELIDDYPHFRELDQSFHRTLHLASGNEVGWMIIRAIHTYTAADCSRPGSEGALRRTINEHREILEALEKGDGELAAERVAEHIKASWAERRALRFDDE